LTLRGVRVGARFGGVGGAAGAHAARMSRTTL